MRGLVPVGGDVPAALQPILTSFYEAIASLQNPKAPVRLALHATASTLEATAAAASYPGGAILVEDINSLAVSTRLAGVWTWRRADGTAL